MREFFQGAGVEFLIWIINGVMAVALFLGRNRQALYEKMVSKDIERLERNAVKIEGEIKEYREYLERRLKDGTSTMRELTKSVERINSDTSNMKVHAVGDVEFNMYCKEHENVHRENVRNNQNLLAQISEIKHGVVEIESFMRGGFQTITRLLAQKLEVGYKENDEEKKS